MTKKQWEKFLKELPANPTFEDIGFVGWQGDLMSPKEKKEADEALAKIISKHWEDKEVKSGRLAKAKAQV